jgi:glycosyltransferase involved in cell wall biosynthesis
MGAASRAVHLDCYGSTNSSDPYFQEIHAISKSVAGVVTFKGTFPHGEIGRILRGLHLLVIPSVWYESAPLVLCSALSAGTPVLVSALGGLTEVVKEGHHGFSFPSGDAAALSSLILRLIENPELLQRLNERTTGQARTTLDYVREIESEYFSIKASMSNGM